MVKIMRNFLVGLLALLVLGVLPADAQTEGGEATPQEELDQLLAPIALYPDQLLTQILIAATYPMDVVEAADLVRRNPNLNVEILDQVLEEKNWDPSVKSLAAFPQVLAMMNDQFDWMQRLGNAFLVDQPRVMDTVQRLRQKALAAGSLRTTPQQTVILRDNQIIIEPMQPEVVYVPLYNPMLVYGPWWAPEYPPWFWYPPPIYGYSSGAVIATGIIFGTAWAVSQNHWRWAQPGWHEHQIYLNTSHNRFWNRPEYPGAQRPMPGGTWQHAPEHRRGVAYPDAATRDRFLRVDPGAVRSRQDFRGHEPGQPVNDVRRPRPDTMPMHSAPNVAPVAPSMPQTERPHQRPPLAPTPIPVAPSAPIAPVAPAPPQAERPHQRPPTQAPTMVAPVAPAAPQIERPHQRPLAPTPPPIAPPIAPVAPVAPAPLQTERAHPRPLVPIVPIAPHTPPLDPGITRQQTQMQTQRGMESRRSTGDEAEARHRPSSGVHDPRRDDRPR